MSSAGGITPCLSMPFFLVRKILEPLLKYMHISKSRANYQSQFLKTLHRKKTPKLKIGSWQTSKYLTVLLKDNPVLYKQVHIKLCSSEFLNAEVSPLLLR